MIFNEESLINRINQGYSDAKELINYLKDNNVIINNKFNLDKKEYTVMKLWFNANFYSMKDSKTKYDKVLTNKGVIIAVGDDCDNYHALEKIDLKGAYVYPGFTDSHMHLLGYGRKLSSNNLLLNKNKEEVLKLISSMFKEDTLKVEGYYNIGITKDDLDLISRDHLIILRHNDYHSFTVNSKVLKLTNLTNSNGIITNEQEASLIKPYYENSSKKVN